MLRLPFHRKVAFLFCGTAGNRIQVAINGPTLPI
jgi:hypothetical protein